MPKPKPSATARPRPQQASAADVTASSSLPSVTPPEPKPPAAAEPKPEEKPKHGRKIKKSPWKPRPKSNTHYSFPADAQQLLALDLAGVNLLAAEAQIRLGRAKSQRAELVGQPGFDEQVLAGLNSAIAWYKPMLAVLLHRRTQLRAESRRAQGRHMERAEAIALAADELLHPGFYARVQERAEQLLQSHAADLEGTRPTPPEPSLPPGPPPDDSAAAT